VDAPGLNPEELAYARRITPTSDMAKEFITLLSCVPILTRLPGDFSRRAQALPVHPWSSRTSTPRQTTGNLSELFQDCHRLRNYDVTIPARPEWGEFIIDRCNRVACVQRK
jgi:hypothetical protein